MFIIFFGEDVMLKNQIFCVVIHKKFTKGRKNC